MIALFSYDWIMQLNKSTHFHKSNVYWFIKYKRIYLLKYSQNKHYLCFRTNGTLNNHTGEFKRVIWLIGFALIMTILQYNTDQ